MDVRFPIFLDIHSGGRGMWLTIVAVRIGIFSLSPYPAEPLSE